MSYALVVIANGRGELLERAVASAREYVSPLDSLLICDDSGSPDFAAWLRRTFPRAELDAHPHEGHGPAMARAWRRAGALPADWVLWLEEDMTFQRRVDLARVAGVISSSGVCQMVFKRNSHFPLEVAAGPTLIDRFPPESFTERETDGQGWLDHRLFYSLNPHLVSTAFLRSQRWPPTPNSEHRFGLRLFRNPTVHVGMWEPREAPPLVLHEGTVRTGTGY